MGNNNNFCPHIWTELKYDPDIVSTSQYPFVGGGLRPIHFTSVERWSKECVKCGEKVYLFKKVDFSAKKNKTRNRSK